MRGNTDDVRTLLIELIKRKIAVRAYELYEESGRKDGRDLDDWLHAEDEILGQSVSAPFYPIKVSASTARLSTQLCKTSM